MIFSENLKILGTAFRQYGFEIRVVGGAVRDSILKMEPKDIDLCVNATPQEMIEIVEDMDFSYIPTGLQHGTITIVVNGEQFEVTTLRIDTETDGRHAVIAYTRDFEADAARRDLTINAMSMDFDGKIYDYFGGQEDLLNYQVRFVGDADARVKEDYLRILRYFRFMARFGNINQCLDEVKDICTKENLDGLKTVSVERYWLEMQKLVTSLYANEVLDCMYYHGVLKALGLGKRRHCTIKQSAVGALGTMLSVGTLDSFLFKWKLSADEAKHLRWIVENCYKRWDWREQLVDGVPRQWVLDLSWIERDQFMPVRVANWEIPVFPVTGQDLLDRGMKQGRELGDALKNLRDEWKKSDFTLTKNDLLA